MASTKINFTVPEWVLSFLINDDWSGMEDEETERANEFVQRVKDTYGNGLFYLENNPDLGFLTKNDIDSLGANCYNVFILSDKKI